MNVRGYSIIYILILSKYTYCKIAPLSDALSSRLSLALCVANATDRFYRHGDILLVSLPLQEVSPTVSSTVLFNQLLFPELFGRSRVSIIIKQTQEVRSDERYFKNIDHYIIQVRNVTGLEEILNSLQKQASWNPHATFMVVTVTLFGDNKRSAATLIKQLLKFKVINGVVLLPDPNNTSVFEIYTWFPYSKNNCGNNFQDLELIDKCVYGKSLMKANWFPNKIPKSLNRCPVRVRTVVWPPFVLRPERKVAGTRDEYIFKDGFEVKFMNTLAEMANFSVVYSMSDFPQDWGEITRNGTATGSLLYLQNEQVDIAMSSYAVSIEAHRYFDTVAYNIPEALSWCVPQAAEIPPWKDILVVLSIDTTILLFVTYILVSVCTWRLSLSRTRESFIYKSLPNCLQNSLSVLVNLSVKTQPKSTAVRILFLLWIVFSLHVSVEYQTALMGMFAKRKQEKQIDTVEEIFKNNLNLWLLPTAKPYFLGNDTTSVNVLRNWGDCNDITACLKRTAYEKDSVTCTPRWYQKFVTTVYVNDNGSPLLYCFKESIVTYPLQLLLWKGYPLKNYFTNLIGTILSSGLFSHWMEQILAKQTKRHDITDSEEESKLFKITITHLYLMFAYLLLGYTLAFIAFLFELYHHKKQEGKNKRMCYKNKLC